MSSRAARKPTTVGDVLLYEYFEPLDVKINDLAEILNVHRNTVIALVNNSRKLTTHIVFRQSIAFGTTVDFWLNLPQAVEVWEVQNDARTQEELSRVTTATEFIETHNSSPKDAA